MDMDGSRLGTLSGTERTWVKQAVVSPDATLVAALLSDGLVQIWNYATRSRTSSTHVPGGTAIAFSSDGRALVVGTATGNLLWYPLDVADLFPACASRLNRTFTGDELERYDIGNPRLTEDYLRSFSP
jgi:WD40 repeat protein